MAIIDAYLEAGTLVVLVTPEGERRPDYRLKARLKTWCVGHSDVDPMDLQDHGFPTGWYITPEVRGYRVVYSAGQQTVVEECHCGGKGTLDTQMYGLGRGGTRRRGCCKACTWGRK